MITRWDLNELYHSEDEFYHHGVMGMRWGHRKQKPSTMKRNIRIAQYQYNGTSPRTDYSPVSVTVDRKKYNKQRAKNAVIGAVSGAAGGAYTSYLAGGGPKASIALAAAGAGVGGLLGGSKLVVDRKISSITISNSGHMAMRAAAKNAGFGYSGIDEAISRNNKILREKYGIKM